MASNLINGWLVPQESSSFSGVTANMGEPMGCRAQHEVPRKQRSGALLTRDVPVVAHCSLAARIPYGTDRWGAWRLPRGRT